MAAAGPSGAASKLLSMRILWKMLPLALLLACSTKPTPQRLLVWNGPIYTGVAGQEKVEAMVVEGGKVLFTGDLAGAREYLQADRSDTLDLQGKPLFPGFIESHGHFMGMGRMKTKLDLARAGSFEEVVAMVQAAADSLPEGTWIIGRGWHQDKWDDAPEMVQGQPVHTRISAVSPEHPVWLVHASGHSGLANAQAMTLAGVDAATEIGEEGEIYHFPDGQPTGLMSEGAMNLITAHTPEGSEASESAALEAAIQEAIRHGVTTFQDAGSGQAEIDRFARFAEAGELPLRLYVMLSGGDSALLARWYERGPLLGEHLTVRSIKLYADGALGSRGAWLLQPYSDRPEHYGNPVMPIDYIAGVAKDGLEHGFQVCTHAIGDRANREVLDRYEAALAALPAQSQDHRFRIEHAQHLHPDDIPRFAALGVIASMQGVHLSSDRPWAINRLGRLRIVQGAYMWQSLLQSGATVINGTDVPVEPIDPIACYYSLVTRRTLAGDPPGGYEPEEKLSRWEALASYTREAAYGAFMEDQIGTLEPGKFADFIVLSQDLIEVQEEALLRTQVEQTWIDGQPVWTRPE